MLLDVQPLLALLRSLAPADWQQLALTRAER